MAKAATRRTGTTPLKGRPLDDDGAIVFDSTPATEALAVDEDEQLALTVGTAIRDFIKGLASFFLTAKALEAGAIETLRKAQAIVMPKSAEEDESIQRFCKQVSADKKEVEEHWRITSLVSQFHRRMTARRGKATDALEESARLANHWHNSWTAQERRRAAEAQEKIRREAEEKARRDREEELRRAEEEAVKREQASPDLSDRERRFVDMVDAGVAPVLAATRAGYKDGAVSSARLLGLEKVKRAIRTKAEARAIREQIEARKQAPLEVEEIPEIKPNVTRAGNAYDRTTLSAELLDEQALLTAFLGCKPEDFKNRFGIPADLFEVRQTKLNEYARGMGERINAWPGVRLKKDTRVV